MPGILNGIGSSEPLFKPYVGRIFRLRRVSEIQGFVGGLPYIKGVRQLDRERDFGECVTVLDESFTRVCVAMVDGTLIWISKGVLKNEKRLKTEFRDDIVEGIIAELMTLSAEIEDCNSQNPSSFKEHSKRLRGLANKLRKV